MAKKAEKKTPVKVAEGLIKSPKRGIVSIPGVRTEKLVTLIIGEAPLICHKFSQKLREQILARHMGEASEGRERKDPEANYQAARYRLNDGGDGVPAGGCKAAIVKGFIKGSGVFMSKAKGAIRVNADEARTNLCRIITPNEPTMREDVVRNETGVVDIRHRPEYWPWAMLWEVEYLPTLVSTRQLLQAISTAGFIEGLCEWRPGSKQSLTGSFGTWRLATAKELEAFENDRLFADVKLRAA